MTSPFDEPAKSDRFSAEDAQNRRLIVVPIEHVTGIMTQRGQVVDGIRVNLVDLDADGEPAVYYGALWFGGRLIRDLKPKIGATLLGYVTKVKTAGGFTPWQFYSLTQDQQTVTRANTWLNSHPDFLQTCQDDVKVAKENPTPASQPAPQQPAQQWQNIPGTGASMWPNQQQGQWPQQPPPDPWGAQPPGNGGGNWVPNGPVTPAPPQPPVPPVAPQAAPPQAPPPPPPVPPSSPAPQAPTGSTVMERLRAQAAGQTSGPPGPGEPPAPF